MSAVQILAGALKINEANHPVGGFFSFVITRFLAVITNVGFPPELPEIHRYPFESPVFCAMTVQIHYRWDSR
jgi:hypothetical protein